jgi:hypothetical protein
MQFKRVWVEYKRNLITEETESTVVSDCRPIDDDKTLSADKEIQQLLSEGWIIVGMCPLIGSMNLINGQGANSYMTYTTGIEVFMTR